MEAEKKGIKTEKMGLVRISRDETCYDIPIYVAVNGMVKICSSSKRVLKTKQDDAEQNRTSELGEGWATYKAFIRVDIVEDGGSIKYLDAEYKVFAN